MDKSSKILVTGQDTVIGAAIRDALLGCGYDQTLCAEPVAADPAAVEVFFTRHKPDIIVIAGGKSGGIAENVKHPADLIVDNLATASNLINAAHAHGVKKLLYLASSCSYPRECPQPMKPEYILTGSLEPTNEAYAVAKLAGMKLAQAYRKQHGCDFIVGIPANVFGPGDDFDPETSHVIAALIRKMHEAKAAGAASVDIWGTGKARRDFIFSTDMGSACVHLLENYSDEEAVNIGINSDVSIGELAMAVRDAVGFEGELAFDRTKPDGMPVKCLDAGPLAESGWRSSTTLTDAIMITYNWYLKRVLSE